MIDLCELQFRLIYSVLVAGKSADFAEKVFLRFFLSGVRSKNDDELPFDFISSLIAEEILEEHLRVVRTGNYSKIGRCLKELVKSNLDLANATPEQLEKIHGIGKKTSRFFILWTRPEARYAALDTHILKWLRYLGYDAPKATPASEKRYHDLEQAFLLEADKRGKSPRELDWEIWKAYKNKSKVPE